MVSRVPKRRKALFKSLFILSLLRVFHTPGLHDLRRRGVLPFGLPGAETPKSRKLFPLSCFGVSHRGLRDLRRRGVLPFGLPGAEMPKKLFPLSCFGVSHTGASRLAKTRGPALWSSGCRNAEMPKTIPAKLLRVSHTGTSRLAKTRGPALWSSGCRNTKCRSLFMLNRWSRSLLDQRP
jgi:hypothetical protein